MAGWNTPAKTAAINKRLCDQKTRGALVTVGRTTSVGADVEKAPK
jgi:hypothetical protein